MRPTDVLRAIFYPAMDAGVLMALVTLWLLVSLAIWGGVLGLFLLFLVIPAVFRYQMIILEARARGVAPASLDAEFFNWFGNAWTLFPALVAVLLAWVTLVANTSLGTAWAVLLIVFASVFFPASVAVLAITRSPLQSLNPIALGRLLRRCKATFWMASVFLLSSVWVVSLATTLPMMLGNLVSLFLLSALFSLTGSLIEPYGLLAEVSIPDALERGEDEIATDIEKQRTAVLNHAYGFVSRGNRAGGFRYVMEWLADSSDPVAAWAWFFERMLQWEDQEHALFFAQLYIHDMLQHGEKIPALKVILRCRMINERFRPLREDLAAAIAAAEASGNIELADVLKRN